MLCGVRVTLCVSGIVKAVHQSSSKLGDTPLARSSTSLSHCLPGGLAVEPLQQTLQQNRALHRSTSDSHRPAPDVELYSSTALQSALHLYISTALYTLHPLHPPSAKRYRSALRRRTEREEMLVFKNLLEAGSATTRTKFEGSRTMRNRPYPVLKCSSHKCA